MPNPKPNMKAIEKHRRKQRKLGVIKHPKSNVVESPKNMSFEEKQIMIYRYIHKHPDDPKALRMLMDLQKQEWEYEKNHLGKEEELLTFNFDELIRSGTNPDKSRPSQT